MHAPKVLFGAFAVIALVAVASAAPINRGGWTPPAGGWDIVLDMQHVQSAGIINGTGSSLNGPDGNARTWNDNWDADDVTTLTIAGEGETEDGDNPSADAIVLQIKDDSTAGNDTAGFHGRRIKLAYPLPGLYDTSATGNQRDQNIINKAGGLTILVRFKVVAGTYMEPDTGIGETAYRHEFVGFDASMGDDDRGGIEIGTDRVRFGSDTDTRSTSVLVGDMTSRFRAFWIVFEPGVNPDNYKGTLYMDGQTAPVAAMGGPGDTGPDGHWTTPPDGDESLTENWFSGGDQVSGTTYPEFLGKAFIIFGPGRSGATVTWHYDYICAKVGAFHPTAIPTQPPAAPSNLTAPIVSATRVQLSWTDNSNNETGFKIERKEGSGSFQQIGQVPADVTTYEDATVLPLTSYTYQVRATNASGDSAYSNEVPVTTPELPLGARHWKRYEK